MLETGKDRKWLAFLHDSKQPVQAFYGIEYKIRLARGFKGVNPFGPGRPFGPGLARSATLLAKNETTSFNKFAFASKILRLL